MIINTILHMSILRMNAYWRGILCVLFMLGSVGVGIGQIKNITTNDGEIVGKVKVTYMVISPTLMSTGKSLNLLNHKIDVGKYPDAKLRVKLEVIELNNRAARKHKKYYLEFTSSSTKPALKGFYNTKRPSKTIKNKGENYIVTYKYNYDLTKRKELGNELLLSIYVYNYNDVLRGKVNLNSRAYKIINAKASQNKNTSRPTAQQKAENLYLLIQSASQKRDDGKELNQLCEEFANKYADDNKVKEDTKDKVIAMCSNLDTEEDPKTMSSKDYYTKIKATTDAGEIITILNDYSNSDGHKNKSDPFYAKIYYHVIKNESIPKLRRIEYCRKYIHDLPNSQYKSQVEELLAELQQPIRTPTNPDDKKWQEIKAAIRSTNSGDEKIRLYKSYLKKYDDHKKEANKALKFLEEEFTVEEISREEKDGWATVKFKISGAEGTEPAIRTPSQTQSEIWTGNIKSITLKEKKLHELTFYLPFNDDKSIVYKLDLAQPPLVLEDFKDAEGRLELKISGGQIPYIVLLKNENGFIVQREVLKKGQGDVFFLDKEELLQGLSGDYTICIIDSYNAVACGGGNFIYSPSGSLQWLWLPLILLILAGGGFILYKKYDKGQQVDDDVAEKIEQQRNEVNTREIENPAEELVAKTPEKSSKKKIKIIRNKKKTGVEEKSPPEKIEKVATPPVVPPPVTSKPSKLKAYRQSKLEKIEAEVPAFLLDAKHPSKYRRIDMKNTWNNSIVQNIYIHQTCAARLQNFVFEDNKDFLSLQKDEIPEIGGWILGKHILDRDNNKYEVSFERFVDIAAASQNTTQITFGTAAWSRVDMQLDVYEDDGLEIVGWFHTHPGWGVFLSRDDINTHETVFGKPYQIAMEIDSMNAPYDVGFFSRKDNNEINNRDDLKNKYMTWAEFTKWLKV